MDTQTELSASVDLLVATEKFRTLRAPAEIT